MSRGNFIGGEWRMARAAKPLLSTNPADPSEVVYEGAQSVADVTLAIDAAQTAWKKWRKNSLDERAALLLALKEKISASSEALALAITRDTGKALWEARTEITALKGKIDVTLAEGRADISPQALADGSLVRHQPHGVMAVIGPFNFPLSLSHGHIVPSLLAGNTVILKPSEQAPFVAETYAGLFDHFPPGVFNLVQGDGEVGRALSSHAGVSGVLFTGSYAVGRAMQLACIDQPHKILVLEMGGKNATIVCEDADPAPALFETTFAAFVTTGQRCTATSRLILVGSSEFAARFTAEVVRVGRALVYGDPMAAFAGPLVSARAKQSFLEATSALSGACETLLAPRDFGPGHFVSPHIVSAPAVPNGGPGETFLREEIFGPSLAIFSARDDAEAMTLANNTDYGLALSIFTRDRARFDALSSEARAGIINWNKGTVGATGKLPFGGVGKSGNFRPAGLYSGRYATYPVATVVGGALPKADAMPPGFPPLAP